MEEDRICSRWLAIGPLPPPIGGDTVSFSRLVESKVLQEAHLHVEILDTSRKEQESKVGRKLDLSDLKNGVRFFLQAFRYRKQVDGVLVWANSRFSYTLGLLIVLLFKAYGKQVIMKQFGTCFIEEYRLLPAWYQLLIKKIFSRADYFLLQTRAFCRFFIDVLGLPESSVVHFPNFLPFHPVTRERRGLAGRVNCVFVGQIRKEKGVFDILEALRKEPKTACFFYGPLHAADKEEFLRQVEAVPNAVYCGVLDQHQVIETISRYDVLLLPSYHIGEGYPGVILEAFFSCIPVIATNWRMLPEIVLDGHNGYLVSVRSPEEIVQKLRLMAENEQKYIQMCLAANETAHHFTEEKVVGEILLPLLGTSSARVEQRMSLEGG
ncbi:glycosyltransferase family 4 protein [Brevibacillus massiliensis]|uniref:glycosyltransferase family 4 protein n=1 Tax=Brevibacillus massiliensis TaxID=1118054 RepID=UPI0002F126FD|nr:glycosyltransferase family 4 protein [Brevibacillus massiliensis]